VKENPQETSTCRILVDEETTWKYQMQLERFQQIR